MAEFSATAGVCLRCEAIRGDILLGVSIRHVLPPDPQSWEIEANVSPDNAICIFLLCVSFVCSILGYLGELPSLWVPIDQNSFMITHFAFYVFCALFIQLPGNASDRLGGGGVRDDSHMLHTRISNHHLLAGFSIQLRVTRRHLL